MHPMTKFLFATSIAILGIFVLKMLLKDGDQGGPPPFK